MLYMSTLYQNIHKDVIPISIITQKQKKEKKKGERLQYDFILNTRISNCFRVLAGTSAVTHDAPSADFRVIRK